MEAAILDIKRRMAEEFPGEDNESRELRRKCGLVAALTVRDMCAKPSAAMLNWHAIMFWSKQAPGFKRHPLDGHPAFGQWQGFFHHGKKYKKGDFVDHDQKLWIAMGATSEIPGKATAWRIRYREWDEGITCQPEERVSVVQGDKWQLWLCTRATTERPHHGDSWQILSEIGKKAL